jgi:hypothetical protein
MTLSPLSKGLTGNDDTLWKKIWSKSGGGGVGQFPQLRVDPWIPPKLPTGNGEIL